MMRLYRIFIYFMLLCSASAIAQTSDDCEGECELPYSCQTLIECRVTKMRCLESCRQRQAWIGLTQAVEKFTFSLAKQLEQLSAKFDSLQEYLVSQNDQRNRQISELSDKVDALQKYLIPPEDTQAAPGGQKPSKK